MEAGKTVTSKAQSNPLISAELPKALSAETSDENNELREVLLKAISSKASPTNVSTTPIPLTHDSARSASHDVYCIT